jgi:hypothetical protein
MSWEKTRGRDRTRGLVCHPLLLLLLSYFFNKFDVWKKLVGNPSSRGMHESAGAMVIRDVVVYDGAAGRG